jgi:hypothetical protein
MSELFPTYPNDDFFDENFQSRFDQLSDEIKTSAIDCLSARYEGRGEAEKGKKSDPASQSGTMKVLPFLKMIDAMDAGGVVEPKQHWADAGCGAGIILLFLMAYCHVHSFSDASFFGFDMVQIQIEKAQNLLIKYKTKFSIAFETNIILGKFPENMQQILNFSKPNSIWFVNNFSWLGCQKIETYPENFKEQFAVLLGLRNVEEAGNVSVLILDPKLLDTNVPSQLQCFQEFREVATFRRPNQQKDESVLLFCCRRATQKRLQKLIFDSLQEEWMSPGTVSFFESIVANLSSKTIELASMDSIKTCKVAISIQEHVIKQGHLALIRFLKETQASLDASLLILGRN